MKRTSLGLNKFDQEDIHASSDIATSIRAMNRLYGKMGVGNPTQADPSRVMVSGVSNIFSSTNGSEWEITSANLYGNGQEILLAVNVTNKKDRTVSSTGAISGDTTIGVLKPSYFPMATVQIMSNTSGWWATGYIGVKGNIEIKTGATNTTTSISSGSTLSLISAGYEPPGSDTFAGGIETPGDSKPFSAESMNKIFTTVDSYAGKLNHTGLGVGPKIVISPKGSSSDPYGCLSYARSQDDYKPTFHTGTESWAQVVDNCVTFFVGVALSRGKASVRVYPSGGDIANLPVFSFTESLMNKLDPNRKKRFTYSNNFFANHYQSGIGKAFYQGYLSPSYSDIPGQIVLASAYVNAIDTSFPKNWGDGNLYIRGEVTYA